MPASPTRLTLAAALLVSLAACAPSIQGRPPRGDWEVTARGTVHGTELRYLTLAGVAPVEAPEAATARLLAFLADVGPDWRMPATIDYHAFPDRATLRSLTGFDTNGRALLELDATISIHAADAHEVMHLLTTPTARPLRLGSFWMEGVAMYYTWPEVYFDADTLAARGLPPRLGAWYGQTVHGHASAARAAGGLPALTPLVHGSRAFWALPDGLGYPAAGSFVTHLLGAGHTDRERVAAFRAFLDDANVAPDPVTVLAAFERRMAISLADAEAAWHAFLDDWDEEAARTP